MSQTHYEKIIRANLEKLYAGNNDNLAAALPARQEEDRFIFRAFGDTCCIHRSGLYLNERLETGPIGVVITLYALAANGMPTVREPFKAFKEFPDSMPYAGAFVTHTENILVPYAERIKMQQNRIIEGLDGDEAPDITGGDAAFIVRPLPKITLCYIIYDADEDFPAAVTCLYSNNASEFMPVDGLADVGEYTSRKIINLLK